MGGALLEGLLAAGTYEPEQVAVIEPSVTRRRQLTERHPELLILDSVEAELCDADGGVVLAVKPDQADQAALLCSGLGARRLLSVVAGISTARLEQRLAAPVAVIRAMPNTPALVGAGTAAMSGGSSATSSDLAWAEQILSAVGTVVRVAERHLDAVTALSGSGPAYLLVVAEALIDAGVLSGLPREVAAELVAGTLAGTGRLLVESGRSAESLRHDVTSPGGTTAAGLRILELKAIRSAFIEAVMTAAERSRQLGAG